MINNDLYIDFNTKVINDEFLYYLDSPGKNVGISTKNNIIKFFQQYSFFKHELELWKDPAVKNKIILNRCKYLNKQVEELTSLDILQGFKRSGIYYGYSHFNPLWFKWFIQKFNIHSCYDPCGGWGHRLLGALDLDLYIYNDFSTHTKENVDNIVSYFNITNTVTYNHDCRTFLPQEKFESIFTCPPYYNLEHYECGDFSDKREYDEFISHLFNIYLNTKECNIFGLVIREDLLDISKYKPSEMYNLSVHKAQHINTGDKKYNEILYIFKK